ncbi:hypothetical protein BpHYR1_028863 [Brachionus plicatilis]|uniref:Uncharacterized protein n=1 Tax=Brachionus plicatilis TaxID=10195 RepID=A0A3M7T6J0_BRAPC|nr:hypothetical protein BpHYR1_028863 [Brachionus plicatilis]
MNLNDVNLSEYLVKKGLPLIIICILVGIALSVLVIKIIRRKNYFDYVTEKLIELFDCEKLSIIQIEKGSKSINSLSQKYINSECFNIRIDPTSVFIQLPYYTRFLGYILFWGYFSIQTLFMREIFTDSDISLNNNEYKCFNLSSKLVKALYRCERYGLKSIDEIFDSMDEIAGILALHELNRVVFKHSFRFCKWLLTKRFLKKYCTRLKSQYENSRVPLISVSQINYIVIMAYLSYSIYENLVTEKHYIPVKLVCYSVLIYSSILSAFETVKYLISQGGLEESYDSVMVQYDSSGEEFSAINQNFEGEQSD